MVLKSCVSCLKTNEFAKFLLILDISCVDFHIHFFLCIIIEVTIAYSKTTRLNLLAFYGSA